MKLKIRETTELSYTVHSSKFKVDIFVFVTSYSSLVLKVSVLPLFKYEEVLFTDFTYFAVFV